MNDIFRLNTIQAALLGADPFWENSEAVQSLETLLRTDRLYQVAPCFTGNGLQVTSHMGGTGLSEGIEGLFSGFDSGGFSIFVDPYASFLHRTIRSAGAGAFHDEPLFDRDARENTEVHHVALEPCKIDRQMAISTPMDKGEAMLIAGYGHDEMPAEDSEAMAWLTFLEPAFTAGQKLKAELARFKSDWEQTVTGFKEPALLIDHAGCVVHRSDGFNEQLRFLPELEAVHVPAADIAIGLIGQTRRDLTMAQRPATVEAQLLLPQCHVTLRGMLVPQLFEEKSCLVTLDIRRSYPALLAPLTKRESEVAVLLCRGLADKEIARGLEISPHTARRHVERILQKCGVATRTQAAARLTSLKV